MSVEQVYAQGSLAFQHVQTAIWSLGDAREACAQMRNLYAGVAKGTEDSQMNDALQKATRACNEASLAVDALWAAGDLMNGFGRGVAGYAFGELQRRSAPEFKPIPVPGDKEDIAARRNQVNTLRDQLGKVDPDDDLEVKKRAVPNIVGSGSHVHVVRVNQDEVVKIPYLHPNNHGYTWQTAREQMATRLAGLEATKGEPGFEQQTVYVPPQDENDAGVVYCGYTGQSIRRMTGEGAATNNDALNVITRKDLDVFMQACRIISERNLNVDEDPENITHDRVKGLTFVDCSPLPEGVRARSPADVAADHLTNTILGAEDGARLPAVATTMYESYKAAFGNEAAQELANDWQSNYQVPDDWAA